MKSIDGILLFIIGASLFYIAHRIYTSSDTPLIAAQEVFDIAPAVGTPSNAEEPRQAHGDIQNLAIDLKVNSASLLSYRRPRTTACNASILSPIVSYPVYTSALERKVSETTRTLLLEGGTGCVEEKRSLMLYRVSRKTEEPYLKYLSDTVVEAIYEVPRSLISTALPELDSRQLDQIRENPAFKRADRIVLLRVAKSSSSRVHSDQPPRSIPRYPTLQKENLKSWYAKNPKSYVIDVRSIAEQRTRPIRSRLKIISAPYPIPVEASRFQWNRLNREIESYQYSRTHEFGNDIIPLLSFRSAAKLIVGSGPDDARAIYALREMGLYNLTGAVWFVDGAEAFTE